MSHANRPTMRPNLCFVASVALLVSSLTTPAARASAEPPTLLKASLSIAVPARLAITRDAPVGVPDLHPAQSQLSVDPSLEADRTFSRRGGLLTSAGVPLLVSGLALSLYAAAVSNEDFCGDPINRKAIGITGAAFTGVGVGFTTAGIQALRKASREARRSRSRGTRSGMAVIATTGAFLILGSAFGVPFFTQFCSS